MAMAVEALDSLDLDFDFDFELSGCSTATTTTEDDGTCAWNDWSQVIDWDALPGDHEDFRVLLDSMMEQDDEPYPVNHVVQNGFTPETMDSAPATNVVATGEASSDEDDKGLRLVHLLMAAAEALTGANQSRELARVILVRLKELVSPTTGTNIERLAAYFTDALQGLLEGAGGARDKHCSHRDEHHHHHHVNDVLAAFQLLQDMTPYVKFGHFTANQAILEAVAHDKRVHIVDYDIMEGIQWASLMQALVSRKDGAPAPHLRITAITRGGGHGRKSITTVQETGKRLTSFAASIGQPFSFHQCRLDTDETFRPSVLKLVKGEALVVNCMLHVHATHFSYRAPDSVASFLSGAKGLNPRIVTLVEEVVVGPTGEFGFVERFMDSLHHHSAVSDSLEAGFPMQSRARGLVERVILGPRIAGSLARIYREPGGEEWGEWMAGMGFYPVGISYFNHCQAKLLLGLFNDGYRVEQLGNNRLVLGWKSRRLIQASVWTSFDSCSGN